MAPAFVLAFTLSASAQTRIEPDYDDNKYSPAEDVQIGQEAAAEVRREYPMLNDPTAERFVDRIGSRLASNIPAEYRQAEFRYSFDVVNMREINAFALPGGPMFVNRGMIEASGSEAEVAGVMAHELSHVILRHGTLQASKAQKFQIGAIAGQILGAIVGGNAGAVIAQGSQFGLSAYFLKYGREYEREADLLGAQIMARAGYDPRAMATMFDRIEAEGGSRGPEWLSSHPNPGNRSAAIQQEARMLGAPTYAGNTTEFRNVQARLDSLPAAPTAEQVARAQQQGQPVPGAGEPVGTSGRTVRVEPPSSSWRTYQPDQLLRVTVPSNWQQVGGQGGVWYVPEGGFYQDRNGGSAFTHGVQIGVVDANARTLQEATDALVANFTQSNPQLRRASNYVRANVGGRSGIATTLTNVSSVTGGREYIQLSTVALQDGRTLYVIGVAPDSDARSYQSVFNRVRQGIVINDR